jgi:hypothetical protein
VGWRVEEEGERRQGARGRGGGWRGWRAGAAVVEVVVRETSPMPGLHARCHRRFGLPHSAPMSSGADPPSTPAENRTPRGDNAAWSSGPSAQSAREERGERELARQRGALAGGRHGDIPGRSARDEDGHLSSDPSPSRSRFSIFLIFRLSMPNRDLRQRVGSSSKSTGFRSYVLRLCTATRLLMGTAHCV